MAVSARSLFVACAVLLVASCAGVDRRSNRRENRRSNLSSRRSNNLPNCEEILIGQASFDVVMLPSQTTLPYESVTVIEHDDNCALQGMRLVGALLSTCDPLGPPAPTVNSESIVSHRVHCHSEGPCPAGLSVSVTQYCEPLFES